VAAAALLAGPTFAGDKYNADTAHAEIGFAVSHMVISKVKGHFDTFDASLELKDGKLVAAEATIQAESINTANKKRDDHLRNEDFLHVEKYPEITFVSTEIKTKKGGDVSVTGKFTLHGVTKELTLKGKLKGPIEDPWGNTRVGFQAEATIDRRDYGLTWSKALETGGLVVGNDVEMMIDVEFVKEKPDEG
jgi:polyisoprenoid-binding protein YceI